MFHVKRDPARASPEGPSEVRSAAETRARERQYGRCRRRSLSSRDHLRRGVGRGNPTPRGVNSPKRHSGVWTSSRPTVPWGELRVARECRRTRPTTPKSHPDGRPDTARLGDGPSGASPWSFVRWASRLDLRLSERLDPARQPRCEPEGVGGASEPHQPSSGRRSPSSAEAADGEAAAAASDGDMPPPVPQPAPWRASSASADSLWGRFT